MGAALLTDPERAKAILTTLIQNLSIPVTCKIRILPKLEDSIKLVKALETTGIKAITVHGRTKYQRPRHTVNVDAIKQVCEAVSIPTICNGGSRDIQNHADIVKFWKLCGTSSIMIARAAQWNCSIFRKAGKLDLTEVIKEYLKISVDYDNVSSNTKYCIQNMLRELQESPLGRRFLDAQTMDQLCEVWDMSDYCRKKQAEYRQKGLYSRRDIDQEHGVDEPEQEPKKQKIENGESTPKNGKTMITNNVAFIKSHFLKVPDLPKSKLYAYAIKNFKGQPKYTTEEKNKLFQSLMSFDGKMFSSSYGEKNKKFAEQGAALVALLHLGLESEEEFYENGSILR
jgi:tRNA-dihydrouridine synthase 2